MKTALDSSVILDILIDDPVWANKSEKALAKACEAGQLLIGECVLAEIAPALEEDDLDAFLEDWEIQFLPSTPASAKLAGKMFRAYLERRPGMRRVLPDFLIGAHAAIHAGRLLARDRGYYRDYFKGLELIDPAA